MSNTSRHRSGFTLIELLVVVAIIALLISILLPSLNQARKQAKQLLCATNLRSQGQAVVFYSEDNKGFVPCGIMSNVPGDAEPSEVPNPLREWGTPALAYLKYLNYTPDPTVTKGRSEIKNLWLGNGRSIEVRSRLANAFSRIPQYQCPDHPDPESPLDYVTNAMPIPFSQRNADKSSLQFDDDDAAGVPIGTVDYFGLRPDRWDRTVAPAQIIYMTGSNAGLGPEIREEDGQPNEFLFYTFFTGTHMPFAGNPRMVNDRRHPGGANALFFDGHADTLRLERIDPGWPNPLSLRIQLLAPFGRSVQDP